MYVHWVCNTIILGVIKRFFSGGEIFSIFGELVWTILITYFIIIQILFQFMKSESYDLQIILEKILDAIIVPACILILFSWSYIYVKLFDVPTNIIVQAVF
jgi:hypothetical protein